jgi:hypothetical protein
VIAGKRVMRQSLFEGAPPVLPEAHLVAGATSSHPSPVVVAYALAGAALLVALIALAVALLK